ncbi:MAG: TIGR02452 family protein [Selenomonadaceae bacterium]|nr:TIGR02452 family protein [Selenomonadaceae bacterium]
MNYYSNDRDRLVRIFEDTLSLCRNEEQLKQSIEESISGSVIYIESDNPKLPRPRYADTTISVNKYRTLETAQYYKKKYPDAKIVVMNFASATNVGGGVKKGSKAQEESLCRCSTLYPVLNTEANWKKFYEYHRARRDSRYTDRIIYSPNIVMLKSDVNFPEVMPSSKRIKVDVLTCTAPNLRANPNNFMNAGNSKPLKVSEDELYEIHLRRAEKILMVVAYHGADIFVGGAFGCGAFQNNPYVVAESYKEAVKKFNGYFQEIVFAIYCSPRDTGKNYSAFNKILNE